MANVGSNVVIKMEADASQVDLGMQRATRATKKFKDETKKTQGQMRLMRGGLGQMGHQVQDIAVQLQSGQNAMLVFGQQGSQIASLFGQNGAVIGAILAVGAAIATALMPKFFGATEAAKELKDAMGDLSSRFDTLTTAQKAVVVKEFTDKINENNETITENEAKLESLREKLAEVNAANNRSAEEQKKVNDQNKSYIGISTGVVRAQVLQESSTDSLTQAIDNLQAETDTARENNEEYQRTIDSTTTVFEKMEKKLNDQVATFGLAGAALENYRIGMALLNGEITDLEAAELLQLTNSLQAKQDAADADKKREKDKQKRFKEQQKEISKALKEQEKTARRFADTIGDGFVNAITGAMSFKDAMKNVAQSVVNDLISMIVKKQITDRIFGALMGMTTFKPETTANPVKAQEINVPLDLPELPTDFNIPDFDPGTFGLTSNEGGGFTGRGARSGGIDGKGGFLSILHPNETVIDHTRGQSTGGTVVNQTINISTGVSQTVRAEIANMMPQIQEATKAAVADSRARGGSYSKALLGA